MFVKICILEGQINLFVQMDLDFYKRHFTVYTKYDKNYDLLMIVRFLVIEYILESV